MTFSDGEHVDLWASDQFWGDYYKLSDGTTILMVQEPSGPSNVYVGNIEGYDDLNDAAKKNVDQYYEEQGLLYDINIEVEKAYSEYKDCISEGASFNSFQLSQEIAPTASNDNIMCFITSVSIPIKGQEVKDMRYGAVFDKESGQVLNKWDLFKVDESQARKRLVSLSGVNDSALQSEMEKVLMSENIILFPDHMEISFPEGSLSSQNQSYLVGINYKDIKDIIHDWAVPSLTD